MPLPKKFERERGSQKIEKEKEEKMGRRKGKNKKEGNLRELVSDISTSQINFASRRPVTIQALQDIASNIT